MNRNRKNEPEFKSPKLWDFQLVYPSKKILAPIPDMKNKV